MRDILSILIVLVVVACGVGGYAYGRKTAPMPWEAERKQMYKKRLEIVKQTRGMRETVRYQVEGQKNKPPVVRNVTTQPKAPATTRAAK